MNQTISIIEAHEKLYIPVIQELFLEYAGDIDEDLCFQGFHQELEELPGKYAPPRGALLLALVDKTPAGCVALRELEPAVCEMKRLYVKPDFRKLQIGRLLAQKIIQQGKERGYKTMKLDTLESLVPAVRLYESLGFTRINPYRHNPLCGAVYMELEL